LKNESGSNLEGWKIDLGDGLYSAPDEAAVGIGDISTIDYNGFSELRANINNRRIQAHNITFKRFVDARALNCSHEAGYSFKLPYLPSTTNSDYNGQTIEGGLFVWDGANTKKDLGLAFQWIINPWDSNYKNIQIWKGAAWETIGQLEPDTLYHSIKFSLDLKNSMAGLTIDGNQCSRNLFSETAKTEWGNEIATRLQVEIISIYPPITGDIASHKAYVKDWYWKLEYY
jgi:hypothetical protein